MSPDAFGGGVGSDGGGFIDISNSTITENTASGDDSYGGGFGEDGGDAVTITNTTIARNHNTGALITPGFAANHNAVNVSQNGAGDITFKNTIAGPGGL